MACGAHPLCDRRVVFPAALADAAATEQRCATCAGNIRCHTPCLSQSHFYSSTPWQLLDVSSIANALSPRGLRGRMAHFRTYMVSALTLCTVDHQTATSLGELQSRRPQAAADTTPAGSWRSASGGRAFRQTWSPPSPAAPFATAACGACWTPAGPRACPARRRAPRVSDVFYCCLAGFRDRTDRCLFATCLGSRTNVF